MNSKTKHLALQAPGFVEVKNLHENSFIKWESLIVLLSRGFQETLNGGTNVNLDV